jgi:formylglycine-generating enzyme required for sulfatase activity/tRNA A-37 threonylcarbamoyl transferase component Bud32
MAVAPLEQFAVLPLEVQHVIDRLCTEFERALRAGTHPSLEEYLEQAPLPHRSVTLAELLDRELTHLHTAGQQPDPESYTRRFPEFGAVVGRALVLAWQRDTPKAPPCGSSEQEIAPTLAPRRSYVPVGIPQIAGYEILGELGRGGMGVVYRARHLALNREVALKMMRSPEEAGIEERVRFRLEAEAIAELRHPNIVQVHEAGLTPGQSYLVLELVEGGSLQRLVGRPLPPPLCAEVVETLALAVQHAHTRGIIHRDLKPANILLSFSREPQASALACGSRLNEVVPKIADFGLAKRLGVDSRQTQPGLVVGTPAYMAPEQAETGQPVGPPADIYALGVILYQLLTGRLPHESEDAWTTLQMIREHEPRPPRQLWQAVPRDLETVCLKCLAREPGGRYATAGALAEDLGRWRRGEPITARPVGVAERAWKWCRRRPALAAALAAVAVLLAAVAAVYLVSVGRLREEHAAVLAERARAREAEQQRRLAQVEAVLTAAPESVPLLLQELAPAADVAVPLLRRQFHEARADPGRRLRAAVGLTVFGEPQAEHLLAAVADAPAAESRNLALALRSLRGGDAVGRLLHQARCGPNLRARARAAILLLELGELRGVERLLAFTPDPTPRTALIHEFQSWHGALAEVPVLLRRSADGDCRSGLCAALGRLDPSLLAPGARRELTAALDDLYRRAPDGGTHSAAGWALRRWGVPLPPLAQTAQPVAGRGWFVNRRGLTMIVVPPGQFVTEARAVVRLTRPYCLSDREISLALFREFVKDPQYPAVAKPAAWRGPTRATAPAEDCPASHVSHADAIRFCNCLSVREGRRLCYRRAAGAAAWECDFAADGYRLPTEAEWEYACRAGSATRFFFGDEPQHLPDYAQVISRRTAPGASKMPNRWGLFDMVGNLWEWCWDWYGPLGSEPRVDPTGPATGSDWILRGGAYDSGTYDTGSAWRFRGRVTGATGGFRVACGMPARR